MVALFRRQPAVGLPRCAASLLVVSAARRLHRVEEVRDLLFHEALELHREEAERDVVVVVLPAEVLLRLGEDVEERLPGSLLLCSGKRRAVLGGVGGESR